MIMGGPPSLWVDPKVVATAAMFEQFVLLLAKKLGVPTRVQLPERVRELLGRDKYELALIEYRKETGAGLQAAIHIVKNGGKLDLETIFARVLAELDRRFPDAPPG
ncbi:MAG TPA: hypothetical protein VFW33_08220 [Gemmataceae bacterium]|nr:hypothetical protein [Gemmataceae bacterium]